MRPVQTVRLWREHQPVEPSAVRDVVDIVLGATLLGLLYVITVLVMA